MIGPISHGEYDIQYEHSGRKEGFLLADGEQGKAISWLLEDALAPQRQTAGYGYAAEPNDVNVVVNVTDWSGGAGLRREDGGAQTTNSYSYSRGVDLSHTGRMYLSPLKQAGTDLSDGDITKVLFTSLGVFAISATTVWEWDSGTSAWTSRVTSATPTDIIEFEDAVIVAMGSNAYRYSTDGTSWTTSTASTNAFSYFAVRSGSGGSAVLWGITSGGSLHSATDYTNASEDWDAGTLIGDSWETITAMQTAEDYIYVFKEEGIYSYDDTLKEDVYPGRSLARPNNGKQTLLWTDGFIYTNLGAKLFALDPATRQLQQVWPLEGRTGHPELNGDITAIGGDDENIYFALKNAAGNTYIIKGDPATGSWHTWVYLGANDCDAISVQRAGAIHASNPVVVVAYGTNLDYYILPGPHLLPENDASYQFDTAGGFVVFPLLDAGASLYSKFLTAGRMTAENTLKLTGIGNRDVTLSYAVDGSATFEELAISNTPGIVVGVPPDAVKFTWIQPKLALASDLNTDTPILTSFSLDTTPNPPRRRKWRFVVDFGTMQASPRLGLTENAVAELREFLISGLSSRGLLYIDEKRWVVKMRHAEQVVEEDEDANEPSQKVAIEVFEMGATGYLSAWFGTGSKYLLPDLPGGAVGLNDDTSGPEETAEHSASFYPEVEADHGHWINGNQTHSFIRFVNVTVPPGATIVRAYVRLRLFNVAPGTADPNMNVTVSFEDADDAVAPTDATEAEALTLTTANAAWTETLTGADAWWTWFQSPDLATVVQEITDRAGWTSGNAMQFVGKQAAVTGSFYSRWFDTVLFGASQQETYPELVIEWNE